MDNYLGYLGGRLVQFVLVVLLGITIAFFITHLSPIDPVEQVVSQLTAFSSVDPAAVELLRQSLRELYGVGGPLHEQFFTFWGRILQADFGPSISAFPTPVWTLILRALPWSVGLMFVATIIAWVAGNIIGGLAGYYRNNRALKLIGMLLMAVNPIPFYIVGLLLLIVFGYVIPILPISGGSQMNLPQGWTFDYAASVIYHSILPATALVLASIGGWFLGMRSLVSNVVTDDYVIYAELGGVRSRTIFGQYVVRNAIVPQVTGLAMSLGNVFGGTVIVESVFSYPGIGKLMVDGVQAGDYSLVLGVTTIAILGVAVAVLVIDIVYPLLDPRMRPS